MQYRHNPPTLSELRAMRREAQALLEDVPREVKKGLFSKLATGQEKEKGEQNTDIHNQLLSHEMDVIVAHLENQNELLLELIRKIDRLDRNEKPAR